MRRRTRLPGSKRHLGDGQVAPGVVAGGLHLKERAEHPERLPLILPGDGRVQGGSHVAVLLLPPRMSHRSSGGSWTRGPTTRRSGPTGPPASKLASGPGLSRRSRPVDFPLAFVQLLRVNPRERSAARGATSGSQPARMRGGLPLALRPGVVAGRPFPIRSACSRCEALPCSTYCQGPLNNRHNMDPVLAGLQSAVVEWPLCSWPTTSR